MRKTMTIAAAMLAAMMMLASVASAQVPGDGGGDPVVDPYYIPPTEEPTPSESPSEGGGVSPTEVPRPPATVCRGVPQPAAQPQLAETGMTLSVGLVAGFGLLALGGGLLLVSRRRKSALQ